MNQIVWVINCYLYGATLILLVVLALLVYFGSFQRPFFHSSAPSIPVYVPNRVPNAENVIE